MRWYYYIPGVSGLVNLIRERRCRARFERERRQACRYNVTPTHNAIIFNTERYVRQ